MLFFSVLVHKCLYLHHVGLQVHIFCFSLYSSIIHVNQPRETTFLLPPFFWSEGTMSGGGNKVVKGRMGSSIVSDVSPEQLETMEKILEKETKTAEVCMQYHKFSQKLKTKLVHTISSWRGEYIQWLSVECQDTSSSG